MTPGAGGGAELGTKPIASSEVHCKVCRRGRVAKRRGHEQVNRVVAVKRNDLPVAGVAELVHYRVPCPHMPARRVHPRRVEPLKRQFRRTGPAHPRLGGRGRSRRPSGGASAQ